MPDFPFLKRIRRSSLIWLVLVGSSRAQQDKSVVPDLPPNQIPQQAASANGPEQKYVPGEIATEDVYTGLPPVRIQGLPATAPRGRRSLGVALEGGGALGLAHIGVLKWLEEHRIPVDRIAGTSMGCLVSALYASGKSPAEMETLTESDVFSNVLTLRSAYAKSSFRRKQDQFEMPQALTIGLKNGVSLRNSLLADASLNSFLTTHLFTYAREGIDFNRLPIPLRCVATDLDTLKRVVFVGGPVPVAVRASISIPGVFAPVLYQGHHLVDGAIMDNLPTDLVREDLQADIVLAVHLINPGLGTNEMKSLVGVFARAYSAGTALNERRSEKLANLLITVNTSTFSTNDYSKAKELIDSGYAAAERSKPQLMAYSLDQTEWAVYLADRNGREHAVPGSLTAIQVGGEDRSVSAFVKNDLKNLKGKQMDPEKIAEQLTQIQSDGSLQTKFETYASTDPQSTQRPVPDDPDTGLLVQFRPVPGGPPFLLAGPEIAAETSNVTRAIFAFRAIDQNFWGYGSELRTDIRTGYMTSLSSEYYRRLGPKNFFLQPQLTFDRRPVYIWRDQRRVGEQLQQMAGGGLSAGRTFNNQLQVHASWTAQVIRWKPVSGLSVGPSISGTSQIGMFHVNYDGAGSSTISGRGLRLDVSAGALYRGPAGESAPLLKIYALKAMHFGERNIVLLSGDVNSLFRHNVSQPLRFTLGGPFRLGASSLDEYRGTDTALLRAAYLRQIASLPTGFGQGVYVTFGYEAGHVWSPETTALLRQDMVGALVAATPIGAITFGTAIGDAGRRKVVFTFGRIF